jgi:hypothetical protein
MVVTEEKPDRPDVIGQLLGECQGRTHQAGKALPQRGVEPFEVMGYPGFLADRFVPFRRNHARVHGILIGIECYMVLMGRRDVGPYHMRALVTPIPDVKRPCTCTDVSANLLYGLRQFNL